MAVFVAGIATAALVGCGTSRGAKSVETRSQGAPPKLEAAAPKVVQPHATRAQQQGKHARRHTKSKRAKAAGAAAAGAAGGAAAGAGGAAARAAGTAARSSTANSSSASTPIVDPSRPPFITGLSVNPLDGSILLATNLGLYHIDANGQNLRPLASTVTAMGKKGPFGQRVSSFVFVGPNRLIGSGHPNSLSTGLNPFLGVIESDNGGQSWTAISRVGFSDLHAIAFAHGIVYGFDTLLHGVIVSHDLGRQFSEGTAPPAAVLDLAVDPNNPNYLLASTPTGIFRSTNQGKGWSRIARAPNPRLAWTSNALVRGQQGGTVMVSHDRGSTWTVVGKLPGDPDKLIGLADGTILGALVNGTIVASHDSGRTWTVVRQA